MFKNLHKLNKVIIEFMVLSKFVLLKYVKVETKRREEGWCASSGGLVEVFLKSRLYLKTLLKAKALQFHVYNV